jgi:hypothetical protein
VWCHTAEVGLSDFALQCGIFLGERAQDFPVPARFSSTRNAQVVAIPPKVEFPELRLRNKVRLEQLNALYGR